MCAEYEQATPWKQISLRNYTQFTTPCSQTHQEQAEEQRSSNRGAGRDVGVCAQAGGVEALAQQALGRLDGMNNVRIDVVPGDILQLHRRDDDDVDGQPHLRPPREGLPRQSGPDTWSTGHTSQNSPNQCPCEHEDLPGAGGAGSGCMTQVAWSGAVVALPEVQTESSQRLLKK